MIFRPRARQTSTWVFRLQIPRWQSIPLSSTFRRLISLALSNDDSNLTPGALKPCSLGSPDSVCGLIFSAHFKWSSLNEHKNAATGDLEYWSSTSVHLSCIRRTRAHDIRDSSTPSSTCQSQTLGTQSAIPSTHGQALLVLACMTGSDSITHHRVES